MNIVPRDGDDEIAWIDQLEQRARPIPTEAWAIRNLITRFEICHFKLVRHLQHITEAIGNMHLDLDPDTIGRAHPRWGENAWRKDPTGRSRIGQEYIWILQLWLLGASYPEDDPREISRSRFEAIHATLGELDERKKELVTALIGRLQLRSDRPLAAGNLSPLAEQIERTDICHYAFPNNLVRMIRAIGGMRPVPAAEFEGCGTCGTDQIEIARSCFADLVGWLHDVPGGVSTRLGEKTLAKEWLVASLAKTLKEHAGLSVEIRYRL